jgi:hypothetical protein
VVRQHNVTAGKLELRHGPRTDLGQVSDGSAHRGALRWHAMEQPQDGERGVPAMDRSHVLPPRGLHRERLELAEHGLVVIAYHEGYGSVHEHP